MHPFSLIICTYRRPQSLMRLLCSVAEQDLQPLEILVIDGSEDDLSQQAMSELHLQSLRYIGVGTEERGLTRQRNVGVRESSDQADVLVFLDDDLVLEPRFFRALISCLHDESTVGVEGCIVNENRWEKWEGSTVDKRYQYWDGYRKKLGFRDRLRAFFGLYPFQLQPGKIPPYGHGKSALPPNGKTVEVDHLMGGMTAYRKSLFEKITFSSDFEGYGLYEDFDFSVRASRHGKLMSCTEARCNHFHHPAGRPNYFQYGKMVIKNGYRVFRLKFPNPSFGNRLKWYTISWLLTWVRLGNGLIGPRRKEAFLDFLGRTVALLFQPFRGKKY